MENVICKICGFSDKRSIQIHLRKEHALKAPGYRNLYPGADIFSDQKKLDHKNALINSWQDPIKRNNRVKALQKAHKSDSARMNHSNATKLFLSNPENLRKKKQELKNAWAKPENRIKILQLSKLGLKAAMSPEGRKNFYIANQSPELRKKRSKIAKLGLYKRMVERKGYSKLNDFFEQVMNKDGLNPEREFPLGPYFVDFCFPENKLVVEADGDFWHANPEFLKEKNIVTLYPSQKKTVSLDKSKNTYLKNHGWKLLRFWERDIKNKTENCILKIKETLK